MSSSLTSDIQSADSYKFLNVNSCLILKLKLLLSVKCTLFRFLHWLLQVDMGSRCDAGKNNNFFISLLSRNSDDGENIAFSL